MNKRKLAVISLVSYRIIYEIIYASVVSPIFAYMGLIYEPSAYKLVLSYLIFALIIYIMPINRSSISSHLLSVFLVFTIVPLFAFYWQANASSLFFIYCSISFLILVILTNMPILIKKEIKLVIGKEPHNKIDIVFWQMAVICLLLLLLTLKYGLADFRALNLYDIYEVRGSRSFTGIYGYIINWIPYALIPCLLCTALYMKRVGYVVFSIIVQLYMYLFVGSKTALFSIGLILAAYFFVKRRMNFVFSWSIFLTGLSIVTLLIWSIFSDLMPFAIFPTRLLSIPASISFEHFEFFSNNEKLFFCENFIGRLLNIESPYNMISTYLVADGKSNHCTGFLGDAYDNGGFMVMIMYSVILSIILRYIDGVFCRIGCPEDKLPMFVAILTYSMIYLNDGTLTALFITGGLFIILLNIKYWESVYSIKSN